MEVELTQKTKARNRQEFEALAEHGFKIEECFYEGTFSKICKASYEVKSGDLPAEQRPLVCKIIQKDSLSHGYARKLLPMHLEVLSRLAHAHILALHSLFASELRYFLFTEPCELGNLFDFLKRHGPLTLDLSKYWFRQLLTAVAHCHSLAIAHRNITVKNVLITANREVRLTGFDFATLFSRSAYNRTTVGTALYVPPEILAGIPYDATKGDVWCLGIVLVYMLTRTYAFHDPKPSKLLKMQQAGLRRSGAWAVVRKLPEEVQECAQLCLKLNPTLRPTVEDLLKSPWLSRGAENASLRKSRVVKPLPNYAEKEAHMSLAIEAGIVTQIIQLHERKIKLLKQKFEN